MWYIAFGKYYIAWPQCEKFPSKPNTPPTEVMKQLLALLCTIITLMLATASTAAITISVRPSQAPNAFGSTKYPTWAANAVTAMRTDANNVGTPGTPGFWQQAPMTLNIGDVIVTGFPSWRGSATPGSTYGSLFENEFGNRLHFSLSIEGDTQFAISDLTFTASSSDPGNVLGFTFATGSYNYSEQYVGVLKGADNQLGTTDDILVTSGANTQLVDALYGRGSGNALDIYDADPGATRQDKINGVWDKFGLNPNDPFVFSGVYTLGSATGGASLQVVPEPSAALCLFTLLFLRGRRR